MSTEMCRICGDYKPTAALSSSLDSNLKTKLELYFKLTLDLDQILPTLICTGCSETIEKTCQFVQRMIDVQERLKTGLLEQLNEMSCDEFEHFELKIERLDFQPIVVVERLPEVVKKEKKGGVGRKNRGIKMMREIYKYTMDNLFVDELKGRFKSEVDNLAISYADKEIDGKISEDYLATISNVSWFNYEWKCLGCSALFTNVMDLEKHSLKCTKKRCFNSCKPCLKDFPSYSTFINHITEKHQPILKFACLICSEFRWNFVSLHKHQRKAHPEHKIFICLYCGKNYFTGALLRDHLVLHRPDTILPEFFCDLCDFKANKKTFLFSHMIRFHLERKFTCEICAFSFTNRGELNQHLEQHSDEANEVCPECGKAYKNKRKLRRHVRNVHEESNEVWTCEICGKVSNKKKNHLMHLRVHSDKDHYKCEYCDRTFKHASGYRYHTRTHTGERPYDCPVAGCDYNFIDWPNCKKHIKSSHGLTGLKPLPKKSKN